MAASLLATGKVVIKGDGIDDEIDFGMKNTHMPVLSGAALWTATTTSDPIANLEEWCETTGQDSGIYPSDAIFGKDVAAAFRKHPVVLAYLDNKRVEIGTMAPRQIAPGVKFLMRLDSAGIDIWTYAESYWDEDTSALKSFVPANKIFLGSRDAYTKKHYGVIQDLEAGVNAAVPFFPKTWMTKDPSAQQLLLQSAPLVAMHQVDAFMCIQPVA